MAMSKEQYLSGLQSDDAEARYAAWSQAGEMPAEVVGDTARLVASDKAPTRFGAEQALENLVHAAGAPGSGERRTKTVDGLLALLADGVDNPVRTQALRSLSLIGRGESIEKVAALLENDDLREEAAFCLERIPGDASLAALRQGYGKVPAEFRPRILAALGHRQDRRAVNLCMKAMDSKDVAISVAAMKALARIGETIPGLPRASDPSKLTTWQKIEQDDSVVRYAEAQVARGEHAAAWAIYASLLDREEEHLQCAAIVGLAKMGTSGAAAAIFPKLSSSSNTVSRTAAQAWNRLRKGAAAG